MMPAKYRATAIDNMQQKFGKDRMCSSGNMLADRHTNMQTNMFITILCSCTRDTVIRSMRCYTCKSMLQFIQVDANQLRYLFRKVSDRVEQFCSLLGEVVGLSEEVLCSV